MAVHADLVNLEKRIVKANNKHNEFLKELGLSPLPVGIREHGLDAL